jgi:hypothetical protein
MHSSIERRDDVQIGARENASELVEESQPDNSAHFDIDRKAPSPGLRKRAAVAGAVIVFGLVVGSLTRLFVFEAGRSFILDLTSGGMGAVSGAYGGFILAAVIYAVVIEDAVESDSIGDLILAALIVVLSIAGSIAGATVAIFLYRLVHGLVL